jgi:hypothetical protein
MNNILEGTRDNVKTEKKTVIFQKRSSFIHRIRSEFYEKLKRHKIIFINQKI